MNNLLFAFSIYAVRLEIMMKNIPMGMQNEPKIPSKGFELDLYNRIKWIIWVG